MLAIVQSWTSYHESHRRAFFVFVYIRRISMILTYLHELVPATGMSATKLLLPPDHTSLSP
jgi:hypothetical protein